MRKKDLVPDASVSILLTIPEGVVHREAAAAFLATAPHPPQPFFFNPEEETVTIGLVRELVTHSSYARAASEPQALVVCAAQTAGIPAQNALLKIVEEPPAHTQIILTVTPGHQLLPTLLSRCREILWTETPANQPDAAIEAADSAHKLEAFLQQPQTFPYNQLITLAEQFKDSATAKQVLKTALHTHAQPDTALPAQITQQLLSALAALEKNGNVRLTLEHYFFAIRDAADR